MTADGVNRSLPGRMVAVDLHKPLKDGKPGRPCSSRRAS